MSNIGFARVSSSSQDLSMQLEALKIAGCTDVFHGKASGVSDENETKLSELFSYIRKGDVVIDTSNTSPFAKATVALISVFAQLDRDMIVARTSEGRAAAIASGKHMGRPPKISDADRVKIKRALKKDPNVSAQARKYGVSRTTIRRIKNEDNSLDSKGNQ